MGAGLVITPTLSWRSGRRLFTLASRLRAKLGDSHRVQTVWGRGYTVRDPAMPLLATTATVPVQSPFRPELMRSMRQVSQAA